MRLCGCVHISGGDHRDIVPLHVGFILSPSEYFGLPFQFVKLKTVNLDLCCGRAPLDWHQVAIVCNPISLQPPKVYRWRKRYRRHSCQNVADVLRKLA